MVVKPPSWEGPTKRWVLAGGVVILALVFWQIHTVLPPLILALILAYLLNPFVDALRRVVGISRGWATLLVYLVLLLLLVTLPIILIPPLVGQIRSLNLDFQAISQEVAELVAQYQKVEFLGFTLQLSQIYEGFQSQLAGALASFASRSINLLLGAASSIVWLVFILFVSFYILKDGDRIASYLDGLVPADYRQEMAGLRREIGEIWNSFLRGQVVLSLSVGIFTGLAVGLAGVPNALLLGFLAGILEVIPNIGPVLAAIPAVILAFFQGSSSLDLSNELFTLLVIGIYFVIQLVENNILVPRIIGGSVNLHPAAVLVGAVAGASVAGLLGIFLAAPVIASLRLIGRYLYGKLLEPQQAAAAAGKVAHSPPRRSRPGPRKPRKTARR